MDSARLDEIEEVTEDAWFISEVRPFVTDLVAEVRRLQKVESALKDAVAWKRTQVAALTYRGPMWPGEDNYQVRQWAKDASLLKESADELERISNAGCAEAGDRLRLRYEKQTR